jgi:hypothetical protein
MVLLVVLELIFNLGLFLLLSWLLGVTVSKMFNLVEGRNSGVLFILRGGLILVFVGIVYLYCRG